MSFHLVVSLFLYFSPFSISHSLTLTHSHSLWLGDVGLVWQGGGSTEVKVIRVKAAPLDPSLRFHVSDVIVALNGVPVTTKADFVAEFSKYSPGDALVPTLNLPHPRSLLSPFPLSLL